MMRIEVAMSSAAMVTALLGGCATEPAPYLESRLGEAVRAARVQQTIDLDASKNTDPVAGMDGTSAKTSIERYYKSFEAPPPTFTIINVGGSTAK
jgi:PBP1b-binding outer membrane lipoprotein LpoB